jgi:hypothetical protein
MSGIRNTVKYTYVSDELFSRRHTYYQEERVEKGPLLLPTSRGGRPFLAQDRQHASFIHIFLFSYKIKKPSLFLFVLHLI